MGGNWQRRADQATIDSGPMPRYVERSGGSSCPSAGFRWWPRRPGGFRSAALPQAQARPNAGNLPAMAVPEQRLFGFAPALGRQ